MSNHVTLAHPPWAQAKHSNEEVDFREIIAVLWKGKYLILGVTLAFFAAGVAFSLYKPNVYQASVLLAPTNEEGSISGISGQLGGLASLAGISVGANSSNKTVIAKETLQSRAFITTFVRRHNLEVPLIAAAGWDESLESWVYNRDLYNPETEEWLSDDAGVSFKPTDWDLVKVFRQDHLGVSENESTGMITLTVKSLSPSASQQWAEWLVADINDHMRRKDMAESSVRISYLEDKLSDTNIAGMQQVFYQLIESEMRTVMLANAQKDYVLKVIDPPVKPQEKAGPKRGLIIVFATILGLMLAVTIIFLRLVLAAHKASSNP